MTDSKQSEQPEQPDKSPEREPGDDPQAVEPASPEQSDASFNLPGRIVHSFTC